MPPAVPVERAARPFPVTEEVTTCVGTVPFPVTGYFISTATLKKL